MHARKLSTSLSQSCPLSPALSLRPSMPLPAPSPHAIFRRNLLLICGLLLVALWGFAGSRYLSSAARRYGGHERTAAESAPLPRRLGALALENGVRPQGRKVANGGDMRWHPQWQGPPAAQRTVVSADTQEYAFLMSQDASLTHQALVGSGCPERPEAPIKTPPIDGRFKALFIIGAQKSGTTWLFNALRTHPAFVGPTRAYGHKPRLKTKEMHFFNHWPLARPPAQQFLACFSPALEARLAGAREGPFVRVDEAHPLGTPWNYSDFALLDGTPEYLFNSWSPARIKATVPQAKFVIVLRDPVARMFSAWRMTRIASCKWRHGPCEEVPPFETTVAKSMERFGSGPCAFQTAGEEATTWHSCHACLHSVVNTSACAGIYGAIASPELVAGCQRGIGFDPITVSNYAAQIAWWLSFFPPDRFIVLPTSALRDVDRQPEILNAIRDHAGLQGASDFTFAQLASIDGFSFSKNSPADLSDAEEAALDTLRQFFAKPLADLSALLRAFRLDAYMTDLEPEAL